MSKPLSRNDEARNQELQNQIRSELSSLGLIKVNFNYDEPDKPRLEYKVRDFIQDIRCEELKERISSRLKTNIIGILDVNYFYDETRRTYVSEVVFNSNFGLHDYPSNKHGILNLVNEEIIGYRRKYRL